MKTWETALPLYINSGSETLRESQPWAICSFKLSNRVLWFPCLTIESILGERRICSHFLPCSGVFRILAAAPSRNEKYIDTRVSPRAFLLHPHQLLHSQKPTGNMKFITLLSATACASLVSAAPTADTSEKRENLEKRSWSIGQSVSTTSGTVTGHAAPLAPFVSEYLGIPYGQPTTGSLRWAKPVAYTSTATISGANFVS